MLNSKVACEMIRNLAEGITEKDHFGGDAFSANKRMFATVWHEAKKVHVRFTPEQQRGFLESDSEAFNEIDNGWGRQGWTSIVLKYIDRISFQKAIQAAHQTSAIKNSKSKNAPNSKLKSKPKLKA